MMVVDSSNNTQQSSEEVKAIFDAIVSDGQQLESPQLLEQILNRIEGTQLFAEQDRHRIEAALNEKLRENAIATFQQFFEGLQSSLIKKEEKDNKVGDHQNNTATHQDETQLKKAKELQPQELSIVANEMEATAIIAATEVVNPSEKQKNGSTNNENDNQVLQEKSEKQEDDSNENNKHTNENYPIPLIPIDKLLCDDNDGEEDEKESANKLAVRRAQLKSGFTTFLVDDGQFPTSKDDGDNDDDNNNNSGQNSDKVTESATIKRKGTPAAISRHSSKPNLALAVEEYTSQLDVVVVTSQQEQVDSLISSSQQNSRVKNSSTSLKASSHREGRSRNRLQVNFEQVDAIQQERSRQDQDESIDGWMSRGGQNFFTSHNLQSIQLPEVTVNEREEPVDVAEEHGGNDINPNHKNNCEILREFRQNYAALINTTFEKFNSNNNKESSSQQSNDNATVRVKVNDFSLIMTELFKEKVWILLHKFDLEEFHSKSDGYRRLFESVDQFFSTRGKQSGQATTVDLIEVQFTEQEFFEILEFWSSTESTLFFSQMPPKYSDINEQEELEYRSNVSQGSVFQQNRAVDYDDYLNQEEESAEEKKIKDIQQAKLKYQKLHREAESEVERKLIDKILTDIEEQLKLAKQKSRSNSQATLVDLVAQPQIHAIEQNQQHRRHPTNLTTEIVKRSAVKPMVALSPPRVLSQKEKREKNLLAIYRFYCKQSPVTGKMDTFDRVLMDNNVMNMGKFFLFVKDFGIGDKHVKKEKILEMFKKSSVDSKNLTLDEFKLMLSRLAEVREQSQKKSAGVAPAAPTENDNSKSIEILEQFYAFLAIDEPEKLKEKTKNPNLPVATQNVRPSMPLPERFVSTKAVPPRLSSKLYELQKPRREVKESKDTFLKQQNSKMSNGSNGSSTNLDLPPVQMAIKRKASAKKQKQEMYGSTECTWESLQGNKFSELRFLNQSDFKPTDLFDANSPEDDEYLAQYMINESELEKSRKTDRMRLLSGYGEIKENSKRESSSHSHSRLILDVSSQKFIYGSNDKNDQRSQSRWRSTSGYSETEGTNLRMHKVPQAQEATFPLRGEKNINYIEQNMFEQPSKYASKSIQLMMTPEKVHEVRTGSGNTRKLKHQSQHQQQQLQQLPPQQQQPKGRVNRSFTIQQYPKKQQQQQQQQQPYGMNQEQQNVMNEKMLQLAFPTGRNNSTVISERQKKIVQDSRNRIAEIEKEIKRRQQEEVAMAMQRNNNEYNSVQPRFRRLK